VRVGAAVVGRVQRHASTAPARPTVDPDRQLRRRAEPRGGTAAWGARCLPRRAADPGRRRRPRAAPRGVGRSPDIGQRGDRGADGQPARCAQRRSCVSEDVLAAIHTARPGPPLAGSLRRTRRRAIPRLLTASAPLRRRCAVQGQRMCATARRAAQPSSDPAADPDRQHAARLSGDGNEADAGCRGDAVSRCRLPGSRLDRVRPGRDWRASAARGHARDRPGRRPAGDPQPTDGSA